MKRNNRESLRIALNELRHAYRVFMSDQLRAQYNEENGISVPESSTANHSFSDWMTALDILEETVERVLKDER